MEGRRGAGAHAWGAACGKAAASSLESSRSCRRNAERVERETAACEKTEDFRPKAAHEGPRAGRAEKEEGRPETGRTAPVAERSGGGRGRGGRLEHELEGRAVAGEVVRHVCCARNEAAWRQRNQRERRCQQQPRARRGGAGARVRAPAVRRRPACAEFLAKGNMVRAAWSMSLGFSAARVSCVRPDAVPRSAHAGAFNFFLQRARRGFERSRAGRGRGSTGGNRGRPRVERGVQRVRLVRGVARQIHTGWGTRRVQLVRGGDAACPVSTGLLIRA
jgi:hypothetical protein